MSPSAPSLLQSAIAHHQAGRLNEAERDYRDLLQSDPINVDGMRLLGALYLQKGQSAQAAHYLEKAALFRPQDAEILANLGLALRGAGRPDEAIDRLQQALIFRPDYVTAMNNLASLLQALGRSGEAAALYGRVAKLKPEDAQAHVHHADACALSGATEAAIAGYETALRLNPNLIEALINLGLTLGQAGFGDRAQPWLDKARRHYEQEWRQDPENIEALNNLGNILRQQGLPQQAEVCYRKALALHPAYAKAAINLSTSLRDLNRVEEAIEAARQTLTLTPDSVEAHLNLGVFLQDVNRHEDAIGHFNEALQRRPASLDANWNKSLSLLALGRYAEGWALHEIGLGIPHLRGPGLSPERRWRGEPLDGKHLLICAEQGLGDTLQFVRYAALCKERGARISVSCPESLRGLLAHCRFIDALPDKVVEDSFDYHVQMMSLPHLFGTQIDTIPATVPYLRPGSAARAKWAGKVADTPGLKVGLVWAGHPRQHQIAAHLVDQRRSMTLDLIKPLFAIEGARFYSLQMGAAAAQIDACGLRDKIVDLMPHVQDFEDTAAIIDQLDLVIAVDTAVVHLAGGMGKPVWVLSRFDACWRWLQNRADSPWYPTARVFGQPSFGDWRRVIEAAAAALREKIENRDV